MGSTLLGEYRSSGTAQTNVPAWGAIFDDGSEQYYGDGAPLFTFHIGSPRMLEWLLNTDVYSAAMAFVRGDFDVTGDLEAAIRWKGLQPQSALRRRLMGALAHWTAAIESRLETRGKTARDIHFHYDRSNDFYRLFLDPRMVYSCAYYRSPGVGLEEAQRAKLDHICRKLDLAPGDRLLDIGCGWGALIGYAAEHFGAVATGCTLSRAQYEFASARLGNHAVVLDCDYRTVRGSFDKIVSVGMFEHVGPRRAVEYFRKIATLLTAGGLMLNHAIARCRGVEDDAATHFVRRRVFPGGRLTELDRTIRAAEECGLEVLDVENLRPHYARTCRLWRERLEAHELEALRFVDKGTYRTWRLWLAGSALNFEEGASGIYQILLSRRAATRRRWTRDYIYS